MVSGLMPTIPKRSEDLRFYHISGKIETACYILQAVSPIQSRSLKIVIQIQAEPCPVAAGIFQVLPAEQVHRVEIGLVQ